MSSSSSTSKLRLPDFISIMEDMSARNGNVQAKMAAADEFKAALLSGTHQDRMQFHDDLRGAIDKHEAADTFDKAHAQGRLAWRSWGNVTNGAHEFDEPGRVLGGKYIYPIGADALKFSSTPKSWMDHKAETRTEAAQVVVPSYPSTVLRVGGRESQVWSQQDGTVARLLPEGLNAGFHVFNEVAKATGKRVADIDAPDKKQNEIIKFLGRELRATVTRPELFLKSDLGSYCELRERSTGGVHTTRVHGLAPVTEAKDEHATTTKALRANAVFYETHYATAATSSAKNDGHNEMTVKYRNTGSITPVLNHEPKGGARGIPTVGSLKLALPNHGEPEGRTTTAWLPEIHATTPSSGKKGKSK